MSQLNRKWTVQPHRPLQKLDEGIWTAAGTIKMPLGRFPRRMTVLALESGGSAIWSAVALAEADMRRIDAIGPVKFLIVPNQGHRLDLPAWHARYPDAKVIAPPSGHDVVAEAAPVDATDDIIGDPAIGFERVAGMKADEFALIVRRPSGTTLILNDVLSYVHRPQGIGAQVMARLFGFGVKRPRTSRLVRRMYVEDGPAVAAQFRRWADLHQLRRIVVSHGEVIEVDPAAALRTAAADFG